ncbi:MAG: hypothetical protein WDN46_10880 [Methylocella sp.]
MDRRAEKGETREHRLFSFLTAEANDVVRPIYAKAMQVLLTTPRNGTDGSKDRLAKLFRFNAPSARKTADYGDRRENGWRSGP